jgi:hypothetical protein
MSGLWKRLSGPVKIGLALGLLGALLTVAGLVTGDLAPLTLRTLLLGIFLGGGSWGVVSWAIAAAALDAAHDDAAQFDAARIDAETEAHDVTG